MRRVFYLCLFLLPAGLTAALTSCGGSGLSIKDACNQAMAETCQRTFDCGGAAALASLGSYTTVAECTTGMEAAQCSNPACPAGYSYHADQGQKCVDALRVQVCADVTNSVMPAACDLVCSPGGATGGSGGGFGGVGGGGGTGGSGGSGGLSAQDACKQVLAALCERTSTCVGSAGLSALGYTSVATCTAGEQAQNCATPAAAGCASGTYYPDQAQKCVDGMTTLSCTAFTSGTTPAACDLVCQ